MREFNGKNTIQTNQTHHSHTGLPQRHSRESGNSPRHPSFPRMQEFNEKNTIQTNQTPHSHTGLPQRHSRENGNPPRHPSFPRRRESTIPAHAGIQRKKHHPDQPDTSLPHRTTSTSFPRKRESTPSFVIPAKMGIHPVIRHSREGGNPQFPRMREFNEKNTIQTNQTPHSHTGLPQRHSRENGNPSFVIPAKAGIHNSRACGNSTEKTPSRPTRHITPTQDYLNVIPTKAGIHPVIRHSRACRNSTKKTPSRPTRHLTPTQDYLNVIPAKAGMTDGMDFCLYRNDGVFFPGASRALSFQSSLHVIHGKSAREPLIESRHGTLRCQIARFCAVNLRNSGLYVRFTSSGLYMRFTS